MVVDSFVRDRDHYSINLIEISCMKNVFKNIFAGTIALFLATPLMILFDISINGVFNPEYGIWSRSFLNGEIAVIFSLVFFFLSIFTTMIGHEKIMKLAS